MTLPSTSSASAIVSFAHVSRRFGTRFVLQDVSLHVPRGCVFGLVGENGSGKTTLIRHILGLLRPTTGSVEVFGLDPVTDPVGVLGRTGYLSEARDLPGWMRVDELMRFSAAFHPGWDSAYANSLREQFGIDPEARVRSLSQGQQARAGLLLALAFRPDLLVLDEPSSGLDPVVRRDILEAIIRTVSEEGRTVFFSSHLLDEVERVADQVAMIRAGRIVLNGRLEEIKRRHRRLVVRLEASLSTPPRFEHAHVMNGFGRDWTLLCENGPDRVEPALAAMGATLVSETAASLDEIFVAQAAQNGLS